MNFYHYVTDQGDLLCATGVAAAIAVWAWLYLSRLTATAFVMAYLLTVASGLLLKLVSREYALPVSLASIFTFSDGAPSGHMALATVVYGTAAVFFQYTSREWKAVLGQVACIGVIIAVGVTRVTLEFHTIPDVLAGLVLGGATAMIPAWVLQRRHIEHDATAGRLILAIVIVGVGMLVSGLRMPSTNFL